MSDMRGKRSNKKSQSALPPSTDEITMEESYLIVRIPKSGSTSLETLVQSAFPEHKLITTPNLYTPDQDLSVIEKLRAIRKFSRRSLKEYGSPFESGMWRQILKQCKEANCIISGHIPFDRIPYPENFKLITLLRHPLGRLISEFKWERHRYAKRGAIRKLYNKGRSYYANQSLSDYIYFLADHADLYGNTTTRYLTGSANHKDPASFVINRYWHFGLLEYSDIFSKILSEKTGLPCEMAMKNVSPIKDQEEISSRLIQKFESFNQKDFELYDVLEKSIRDLEISP